MSAGLIQGWQCGAAVSADSKLRGPGAVICGCHQQWRDSLDRHPASVGQPHHGRPWSLR